MSPTPRGKHRKPLYKIIWIERVDDWGREDWRETHAYSPTTRDTVVNGLINQGKDPQIINIL